MATRSFSTLIDLLEGLRDVHPSRGIRLVSPRFRESFYPYAELYRRMLIHADHLRGQGVEAGHRVVIPLATDIETIGSFLGLIWLGAIPISVSGQMVGQDPAAHFERVKNLIERFGFEHLVPDTTLIEAAAKDTGFDPRVALDASPESLDPDVPAPRIPPARVGERDVAFLQFSSGSTSDPKGVQITHQNICTNIRLIVENDGRSEESSGVVWLPLYHDMGLVGGFLSPMVHYHPLVLMNPVCFLMKPVTWLEYISRHRGTVSPVPSFAISMCNTRIRDHQLETRRPDLGSLDYVYNGSEPVSAAAIETFYERFAPYGARRGTIYPVYGMAEATLLISAPARHDPPVTRQVDGVEVISVGRPVGDFEVTIIGEDGRPLPPDQVGEIIVRGKSVTPGYVANDGENERRFRDGWFHTGDLGMRDRDGRLFITGRVKDLIIVDGRNYYAHDIAAKVEELPFVRRGKTHVFSLRLGEREEIVVMTVPNERATSALARHVHKLKEFLSETPGDWLAGWLGAKAEDFVRDLTPADVDALKDELKRYLLREFGIPVHDVFLVKQIPKTTSGKIRRGECEALYFEHLNKSKT